MELKLGAKIKKLRTEKGVTQEELAEYIGISFQSVSKWETDTTMPDITFLPKLAIYFGVRIDDLFSINVNDELERIDYMLEHEKLTDENFIYAKRILDSILLDNKKDVAALKRYSKLLMLRNNIDNLLAGRMLEKAMPLDPFDEEIFLLYRQVRGGETSVTQSGNDWFIRVCEPYAKKYPENIKLCENLIDAMIQMRYFDKANELIEITKTGDEYSSCLRDIWKGDIELAKGNIEEAKQIWNNINKSNHKGQYEVGERYNKLCEYTKAIECYEKSFTYAEYPRDCSSLYSLAFLYTKLKKYQNAINTWQRIIEVLAADWNTAEGETVEWPKREIEKLKGKL